MILKDLRLRCGITQPAAAKLVGIPFRTYCRYEAEEAYKDSFKYAQIVKILENYLKDKVLSLDEIRAAVSSSCSNYPVNACYLFGSYARGKATGKSDIDILVVCPPMGMRFYEIAAKLEEQLHKSVDLHTHRELLGNETLLAEVLKEGIKIYG